MVLLCAGIRWLRNFTSPAALLAHLHFLWELPSERPVKVPILTMLLLGLLATLKIWGGQRRWGGTE